MTYNTSQQNSIKMISYFLIYSRTIRLLIEEESLKLNTLLNRMVILIHKLLLFRESAKIAIKRIQKKIRQDYSV